MKNKIRPTVSVYASTSSWGYPDTGWRCAICFSYAQVNMQGTTLCVGHAKRYNFGYGETLKSMRKEFDSENKKP